MPTKTIIAPSRLLMLIAALIVASMTACRSHEIEPGRSVVVNAPVDGIVRRVIVDSNAAVDRDAAIIEIALQPAHPAASNQPDAAASRAQYASAQTDLASAEGEANRIAADVRRIEPLVKRGLASQAELDKARSQSLDAQERLRLARTKADAAAASNRTSVAVNEEILVVRAPSAGTVQAINVHAGQAVVTGQPLATLVSNT